MRNIIFSDKLSIILNWVGMKIRRINIKSLATLNSYQNLMEDIFSYSGGLFTYCNLYEFMTK